jgi:hypothetical protein
MLRLKGAKEARLDRLSGVFPWFAGGFSMTGNAETGQN